MISDATELRWLVAISIAMLVTAPAGPVASVILMAGRSRQAMFNTLVLVVINVGGNLLFVPTYGITAAGVTWAATIPLFVVVLLQTLSSEPLPASARRVAAASYPWTPLITVVCYLLVAVLAQLRLDVLGQLF